MATAVNNSTSVIDKINNSRNSLANNEQTFLKLLTTQLKNQDPLSPTDTTQMTSQITQMTGVEQQLVTNDLLAALVGMNDSGLTNAVNMMGKQVTAETDSSVLKDNKATWSYTQSRSATAVKIEVVDKYGKTIRTVLPDDMSTGSHTFEWDGKSDAGVAQPNGGAYTIKVTATDADGTKITTTSKGRIEGVVTAVTYENGKNMVSIGDVKVPLDSIIGVTNPPASANNDNASGKDNSDTTAT
ncbi:MAG: flagellar hook assembly protein FlgD [Caulobacter sp.]|nr:flagellar hook assembly protein FlgD [Caulobacter sp.]